jgi:hypothetical protein
MAGVFMISQGTIWWRTGLLPRWLAAITYVLALCACADSSRGDQSKHLGYTYIPSMGFVN